MRTMIKQVSLNDGTVRHQVYGRRKGKKVYVGTYDSKRAAEEAEEDHRVTQRKIDSGELPPELDTRETIREASSRWLAGLEKRGSRSHTAYTQQMQNQVWPTLGGVPYARLRKVAVKAWRDSMVGKYGPGTINSALGCLSSFYSDLVDDGKLEDNPCHGVNRLEVPDREYLWIRTVAEIEQLIRFCTAPMRDLVAVAVGTGMRIDELLHLQWVDVDLERRLITVQRGRKGTPKYGMRHVPILDSVLAVFQGMAVRRGGAVLVFPSKTRRVRAKSTVTTSFKEALVRAGLSRAIRFHDLRHTFASHWVMNGGDIFRLSKVLGHRNVSVTQKTYAHLIPEAWTQDYSRVTFKMPSEARVLRFPQVKRA